MALPPDVRSIRIPVFSNQTQEPDIENIVTRSIKDRFIRDGRLSVVDSDTADSVLTGIVLRYNLRPLSYDTQNNVTSYLAELNISVTHKTASGQVLSKRKVDTKEVYKVEQLVAQSEINRKVALLEAASTSAESILSLVVEAF
ncbi:MAG: LPS assembly lipoprotein LptE [Nitrospinota bacterium]|nr:LPS assembly lipoprotein LptE [Nitrospinota bacterium]MDH5678446.1 LPS assembly lipoprotein LptE [Nitrospinota bacterium]MDH5756571.1 LPS assembly lipoprotein LptE [Nitrospinota bacterium]